MKNFGPIRVLLVDDHLMVRMGLAAVLKAVPRLQIVAEAADVPGALAQFREHRPDVTLMDLRLPGGGGIEAVKAIRAEFAEARILMLTTYELEEEIHRAMQAGASGYLLKNISREDLAAAIVAAHETGRAEHSPEVAARMAAREGASELTPREIEVLQLVVKGLSNADIARILGFRPRTAKAHMKNLLQKIGAADRTEAAAIALQRGIVAME
jgi:DNA-binding NarL/FixJ family response regulator